MRGVLETRNLSRRVRRSFFVAPRARTRVVNNALFAVPLTGHENALYYRAFSTQRSFGAEKIKTEVFSTNKDMYSVSYEEK